MQEHKWCAQNCNNKNVQQNASWHSHVDRKAKHIDSHMWFACWCESCCICCPIAAATQHCVKKSFRCLATNFANWLIEMTTLSNSVCMHVHWILFKTFDTQRAMRMIKVKLSCKLFCCWTGQTVKTTEQLCMSQRQNMMRWTMGCSNKHLTNDSSSGLSLGTKIHMHATLACGAVQLACGHKKCLKHQTLHLSLSLSCHTVCHKLGSHLNGFVVRWSDRQDQSLVWDFLGWLTKGNAHFQVHKPNCKPKQSMVQSHSLRCLSWTLQNKRRSAASQNLPTTFKCLTKWKLRSQCGWTPAIQLNNEKANTDSNKQSNKWKTVCWCIGCVTKCQSHVWSLMVASFQVSSEIHQSQRNFKQCLSMKLANFKAFDPLPCCGTRVRKGKTGSKFVKSSLTKPGKDTRKMRTTLRQVNGQVALGEKSESHANWMLFNSTTELNSHPGGPMCGHVMMQHHVSKQHIQCSQKNATKNGLLCFEERKPTFCQLKQQNLLHLQPQSQMPQTRESEHPWDW